MLFRALVFVMRGFSMSVRSLGLALVIGLSSALWAKALMIAPPPVAFRAAAVEAAVVGKVIKLADKTVPAEMFKGDMRQMMIATVKVEESVLGKPGREIQVGYFPPMAPPVGPGGIRIGGGGRGGVNLVVDQEALLLLKAHPTRKGVLVVNDMFSVVTKTDNPNFKTELDEVKKTAKILAAPLASLKSKDSEERILATSLLITRYRSAPGPDAKTEKVPADESQLILNNLAEADWNAMRGGRFGFMVTPQQLFYQLGLTPADGWTQPRDFKAIPEAAKKWLKDNAGKYQVVRYSRTKPATDPEP